MSDDNPSVNRALLDAHFDNMDHALGRPTYPLRESYRNRFVVDEDSVRAARFDKSPHWNKVATHGDMALYEVTQEGRKALADFIAAQQNPWQPFIVAFDGHARIVPERTRSKAKYVRYLQVAECCPDLTFGDFCRRVTVRRAA